MHTREDFDVKHHMGTYSSYSEQEPQTQPCDREQTKCLNVTSGTYTIPCLSYNGVPLFRTEVKDIM